MPSFLVILEPSPFPHKTNTRILARSCIGTHGSNRRIHIARFGTEFGWRGDACLGRGKGGVACLRWDSACSTVRVCILHLKVKSHNHRDCCMLCRCGHPYSYPSLILVLVRTIVPVTACICRRARCLSSLPPGYHDAQMDADCRYWQSCMYMPGKSRQDAQQNTHL